MDRDRLINRLIFPENARLIDRILFPEYFPDHPVLFPEDEDIFERRQYPVLNRRLANHWDDTEFFQRFRVTKPFFYHLLGIIGPPLAQDDSRFVLILFLFFLCTCGIITCIFFSPFSKTEAVICNLSICSSSPCATSHVDLCKWSSAMWLVCRSQPSA